VLLILEFDMQTIGARVIPFCVTFHDARSLDDNKKDNSNDYQESQQESDQEMTKPFYICATLVLFLSRGA